MLCVWIGLKSSVSWQNVAYPDYMNDYQLLNALSCMGLVSADSYLQTTNCTSRVWIQGRALRYISSLHHYGSQLGLPYTEGTCLYCDYFIWIYLVSCLFKLYCGGFILFCSVCLCVCVCVGFVKCGRVCACVCVCVCVCVYGTGKTYRAFHDFKFQRVTDWKML